MVEWSKWLLDGKKSSHLFSWPNSLTKVVEQKGGNPVRYASL